MKKRMYGWKANGGLGGGKKERRKDKYNQEKRERIGEYKSLKYIRKLILGKKNIFRNFCH